jgi:dissimilatory sulfite reductase (desulfoviridin) alpha/beta subunit
MFRPGGIISARNLRQFVDVTSTLASGLLDLEPQPGAS